MTTKLKITNVPIHELAPAEYNPRAISDENFEKLKRGIDEFGLVEPIVARKSDRMVVGGHQRLRAARSLGHATVPVVYIDVDDQQATTLNVLLNNPEAQGEWDFAKLADVLSTLDGEGADATLTGFSEGELEQLLTWTPPGKKAGHTDVDDAPAVEDQAITQLGDVWLMGQHKLICADATDPATALALTNQGQDVVEVIWTDPPYGVEYVGKTKDALTLDNDGDGAAQMLTDVLLAWKPVLLPGARFYICSSSGPVETGFRLAIAAAGMRLHQGLVWVKDRMVLGHSDYHFKHETVLYGWTPGPGRVGRGDHKGTRWRGDLSQTTTFEIPRPSRSTEHPTMKPVELIEAMLENSTRHREIVADPFAGSGSTILACERLTRACIAAEIDPRYVDVAVRRWQAFANEKATLAACGRTMDEVEEDRLAPSADPDS